VVFNLTEVLLKKLRRDIMKKFFIVFIMIFFSSMLYSANLPISDDTDSCISCHSQVTPGIVEDWKNSAHAKTTVAQAMKKEKLSRMVSAKNVPDKLKNVVVGCAECHTMNPKTHKDTFDHNDYQVHIVVTPKDCAVCHPTEVKQYSKNIMSHANVNLKNNPVYHNLVDTSLGIQDFNKNKITQKKPLEETYNDACIYCHGTKVEVKGMKTRKTAMDEMDFPVLTGWPSQGVGRINPDGSMGACTSCHTRHAFSIEMARKPATCAECHKGPDVPAYKVYKVSKHGNIYYSMGKHWNFSHVPWVVGKDFTAPTCATCHSSLIVNGDGEVIAERTHQMNDRSAWRIFGLIYAHPHPKDADTTKIKNSMGLPMPTELTGEPVKKYLIDEKEMAKRRNRMKAVCNACHSMQWVNNQYKRFDTTIKTTNKLTLTATKILMEAWNKGVAKGLKDKDSIFNEGIEKKWVEQWLFFANSTRFASAMAGADYGAFANGRWYLNKNIQEMYDWLNFLIATKKNKK
jgi:hydroxylamine dehydrogenase